MRSSLESLLSRWDWNHWLPWARVGLGLSAAVGLVRSSGYSFLTGAALVAFATYALVLALRQPSHTGVAGVLELGADTTAFVLLANYGIGAGFWLPAVFCLYLAGTVMAFHGAREAAIVTVVSAIGCSFAPGSAALPVAALAAVAGMLACAFCLRTSRLGGRMEELAAETIVAQAEAKAAREEERQRIASDFHDGPLQSIISLQMRLEIVRKLLERDLQAGMHELQVVQEIAKSQVRELRAFLHSMRPVEVNGGNLSISARRVIDTFQKESGIPVTLVGGDAALALNQEIMAEVLQMLREALHNVQKHAGASRVAVAIQKGDKGIEISVDDNGRGFHFSGAYSLEELELLQLGPASLKRRARSLNADLVLESRPGQGAGLKMKIPA